MFLTKKERTRAAIIGMSRRLFAEKSIAGTSVLDITEALGISNGSFYYHFQSKDHLLEHLGHEIVTSLIAQIECLQREDPAAQIARGPLIVMRYVDENTALTSMILRVIEDHERVHLSLVDDLREDVIRGLATGRFHAPDQETAVQFARALIGCAVRMRYMGERAPDLGSVTAVQTLQILGLDLDDASSVVRMEKAVLDAERASVAR